MGLGYHVRGQHEFLLIGTKGRFKVSPYFANVRSVYREKKGEHSVKSDYFCKLLQEAYPQGRLLELFARRRYSDKWTTWGNAPICCLCGANCEDEGVYSPVPVVKEKGAVCCWFCSITTVHDAVKAQEKQAVQVIKKKQKTKKGSLKFIDLFCGIGGFRVALEQRGLQCVFSSEIDKRACEAYKANFGETPHGDITQIDAHDIPSHDILCAGFPCQPFSTAGKQGGISDPRGQLFHEIIRIADFHKPKLLLLENVKHIQRIDDGGVIREIEEALDKIGYEMHFRTLNASNYGIACCSSFKANCFKGGTT